MCLPPPCHQLLIALEYIHGAKMVHGDIKPANVLLSADGSMLRLADFGLSRFLAETGGTRQGGTRMGDTLVGTLGYLSPEGYAGRSHVKEPADIWAFGDDGMRARLGYCTTGPVAQAGFELRRGAGGQDPTRVPARL